MSGSRDAAWFDSLVHDQGTFNPFTDRGWRTFRRSFERAIPGAAGARLLDIGCGTGSSRAIYEGVGAYVGLDHATSALVVARAAHQRDRWLGGDALRLPFEDCSFDHVAFSSVLHHIADRTAALSEARRVLRPHGRVFAFDPNLLHPAMALFRHPTSPLYRPEGVSPDEKPLRASELASSFREAGFIDIQVSAQADIPYRQLAVGPLNRLLPLYNAADWLMARVGLGRWFGSFLITTARRPA